MTICRPVPAVDGDDVGPVPQAFVGDDIATTNRPVQALRTVVVARCRQRAELGFL
jgi:hypothetical protein